MRYFIALLPLLAGCSGNKESKLKEVATLTLKEVSGLEYVNNTLWALEDSGNKNKIYKLAENGAITQAVTIPKKNIDWEDIAADKDGNLYIGDFGNNENDRKDLAIYKLAANKPDSVAYTVAFKYPDQTEFPPKKSNWLFDVEAFLEYEGNFYLFTKNRSKGFDGTVTLYKVPNTPGSHTATRLGTIATCSNYHKCAITGADISPDGKKAVLLSGEKVWLLTDFGAGDFAHAKVTEMELGHHSQKEGICFKDDDTLLIADEKDDGVGGKLYQVKLSGL
jgi:hypothetical protein